MLHLRPPSVDHGIVSFVWALVLGVLLWVFMLAIGVSKPTAFIVAAVAAGAIFLYVRLYGEDEPAGVRRADSLRARQRQACGVALPRSPTGERSYRTGCSVAHALLRRRRHGARTSRRRHRFTRPRSAPAARPAPLPARQRLRSRRVEGEAEDEPESEGEHAQVLPAGRHEPVDRRGPTTTSTCRWNQFASGCPASSTHPQRRAPAGSRSGRRRPRSAATPTSSSRRRAATAPSSARRPRGCRTPPSSRPSSPAPIWVEIQTSRPAAPAPTRVNTPRTVPTIDITSAVSYPIGRRVFQLRELQPAGVERGRVELRRVNCFDRFAERHPANTCSTTPIASSLWNGTSTWARETRLSESRSQAGQRTAIAELRPRSPGASRKNDDGNTGRGRSSG